MNGTRVVLDARDLQKLLDAVRSGGVQVLGPVVRDSAVVLEEIKTADQLPRGWTDEQEGGTYRLKKGGGKAFFDHVVGPQSWKKYLHKSVQTLFKAERDRRGFQVLPEKKESPKVAFLGVRPCELKAIAIQDKVFTGGPYVDPFYQARRKNVLLIAVNCGRPAKTCFCASMNTGPAAREGFDLALTELCDSTRHSFLIEAGSKAGEAILARLKARTAGEADLMAAEKVKRTALDRLTRQLDTAGLKELLYANLENPRWEETAKRCLSCTNCTMVCPTCFCTTVEDTTALDGSSAERTRKMDSCFTMDFSYIHGGSIRKTAKARYRQWMTHKLASWQDQFGTSGCVGCGRCITWCPVGIDITEEARAIRQNPVLPSKSGKEDRP